MIEEPSKKRSRTTAGQFIAELEEDSDFVRRRKNQSHERAAVIAASRSAARPVIAALSDAGLVVDSIADLVNKRMNYRRVMPLLLEWLPKVSDPGVKMSIARALTDKSAPEGTGQTLLRQFVEAPPNSLLRWTTANALSVVADDRLFAQVAELVKDPTQGRGRDMLALGLGNMRTPDAVDVLVELLGDSDVGVRANALRALRKLRASRSHAAVNRLLDDPSGVVRDEARKTLHRFETRK